MNILFSVPGQPLGAWSRAAAAAGHTLVPFDPPHALEAFGRAHPDLVVAPPIPVPALDKALAKYKPARVIRWTPEATWARPAADVAADFIGGMVRPEFRCDAAYCGHLRDHHVPYLMALRSLGMRFLVFGDGPLPECVGRVEDREAADVYASAGVSLDLDGDYRRVLGVIAAGGVAVSIARYETSGVRALDECPWAHDPAEFAYLVSDGILTVSNHERYMRHASLVHHTRVHDTYNARLADLLHA